jgi:hypothetical protein
VLYYLSHSSSPFGIVIFETGSGFLPWPACTVILLFTLGDDRHRPSHWLKWGLINFLPRLASNHNPPNLCLPSSYYRLELLCPEKNSFSDTTPYTGRQSKLAVLVPPPPIGWKELSDPLQSGELTFLICNRTDPPTVRVSTLSSRGSPCLFDHGGLS